MRRDPAEATLAPDGAGDAVDVDDPPEPPFVHRIVAAAAAEPVRPCGPVSVFGLAEVPLARRQFTAQERGSRDQAAADTERTVEACVRSFGVTRASGLRYPSDRWTQEREERERERRARQRVPRPPKSARTRSRKLRELIGATAAETDT